MANIQISGLTAVSSLTSGDVFALDQSVGNLSKKITTANLATAIVTTTNVTTAGALMDSEVTNLAQVKAFDSADYATAAQGTTADDALPTTGGAMTGAITTTSTFDGRDVATDGTKLDTIATNADITDSTSVTAAGALMDSELTSIADVKALNQSLVSGAAPVLDATNMTNIPSGGVSIGDTIGGASSTAVLFVDGSGNLGNNSKFTFYGNWLNFTGASTTSSSCTSFGVDAGNGNTSNELVSIGNGAGQSSSGIRKTSIGYFAGKSSTGTEGTFLGVEAGQSSGGNRNQYIGYRSGMNRSSGGSNNGIGDDSLYAGSGTQNSAMGSNAQNASTGSYNSSVGSRACMSNSGSNNNAIGYRACESNTGSNVLALGDLAGWTNTQSNRLIIGFNNLPQFTGATVADADAAAAAALPAASANGVYLYWNAVDNTIKARP